MACEKEAGSELSKDLVLHELDKYCLSYSSWRFDTSSILFITFADCAEIITQCSRYQKCWKYYLTQSLTTITKCLHTTFLLHHSNMAATSTQRRKQNQNSGHLTDRSGHRGSACTSDVWLAYLLCSGWPTTAGRSIGNLLPFSII